MKSDKVLGFLLWVIGLIAAHLITFVIPDNYTAPLWITYGFTMFVFLSQLLLWLWIWRNKLEASVRFLHMPVLTVSIAYMLLQLLIALLFSLVVASVKVTILVNAILTIAFGVILVLALIAKNSIYRVDSLQKDHHYRK